MFTEVNPDKGTETVSLDTIGLLLATFTEVNPDKGTETADPSKRYPFFGSRLQKLTPIRGRKHQFPNRRTYHLF